MPETTRTSDETPPGRDLDVSIIIVTWNTREMTLECLRSLYAQTFDVSFEVIVVDNHSHDGSSAAIAAEFPQVRLLSEATNHGFAVANNLAARVAHGRRLLLLNSDTLVLDRAIDRLLTFADTRPGAGIWGGRTVFGDGSLNISSCWGRQTLWSAICFTFGLCAMFPRLNVFNPEGLTAWRRDSVREVDIVCGCFLLIDTHLWRRLDGFSPIFFMYAEEADLCARARSIGARPVVTPAATIVHYGGGSAANRADPKVQLFRSKIGLARLNMNRLAAEAVRWLYLVAVAIRVVGYGGFSTLTGKRKDAARMWRATFARRGEWFSRASSLV